MRLYILVEENVLVPILLCTRTEAAVVVGLHAHLYYQRIAYRPTFTVSLNVVSENYKRPILGSTRTEPAYGAGVTEVLRPLWSWQRITRKSSNAAFPSHRCRPGFITVQKKIKHLQCHIIINLSYNNIYHLIII